MNARDIFIEALQKDSASQRGAYLAVVCGVDEDLRRHVEGLLEAHERASGFLEPPARRDVPTVDVVPSVERPGAMVGPYKLLQQIGEGGMGAVFMAEQTHPVQRRVAVKLIKAGMDSSHVVARFEAERQALALMDHPNIAKVLDAGIIGGDGGRPYFVMELVKGVPITRFCDEHRLTPRQRLELFVPVCAAIQHAHQKGIIHRDIKPSNVLVAHYDGKPVVKVIDFGVAKAIGQRLTEKTLFTEFGAIIGTLEYMSPEQADLNKHDIDTRSDVYALGVLLYELLTGSTPFGRKDMEKAGLLELLRVIREQEPARPSTKLNMAEALPTLATNRGTEPKRLLSLVKGELDWIVMKALEKDRSHRYETANGFAMDVQRHLADEPVLACPPSATYRLEKFLRRHKGPMLAVALVLLVLLGGILGTTWQAVRATWERDRKQQALEDLDAEQQKTLLALTALQKANEDKDKALTRETEEKEQKAQQLMTVQMMRVATLYERDPGQALTMLHDANACPIALRDTAWRYYERCCRRWMFDELRGHTKAVSSVACSPNGLTLASGSGVWETRANPGPGEVRLWDVRTGQPKTTLQGHTNAVASVAFSPDGFTLASGSRDCTVRLWDAKTGQLKAILQEKRSSPVLCVAYSPDGLTLASGGGQNVWLWDAKTGRFRSNLHFKHSLEGHFSSVCSVAFSSDGLTLASGGREDETIRLWDAQTGQIQTTLHGHAGALAVAFHPKGHVLASGSLNGRVQLWDIKAGQVKAILQSGTRRATSVAHNPDGLTLASAADGAVRLWDAKTGQNKATFLGHTMRVTSVAYSPDGLTLASGSWDKTVRLWDTKTTQTRAILQGHSCYVQCVAFSPDGRTLASCCGDHGTPTNPSPGPGEVRLWDARTGQLKALLRGHTKPVYSVAFSPDGRTLASGSGDRTVRLWELETAQTKAILQGRRTAVSTVAFSPDGLTLACGCLMEVWLWDTKTGKAKATLTGHTDMVTSVAFSSDSRTLASGSGGLSLTNEPAEVRLWNVQTGHCSAILSGHTQKVTSVAFSSDGSTLASGSDDGTVRLWDVQASPQKAILFGHTAGVAAMALSSDGLTLASGSQDSTVRLWNARTGQPLATLRGHSGFVEAVDFSPDGRILASGSYDKTVRLWDAQTGELLRTLHGHENYVVQVAFSPDGDRVFGGDSSGEFRAWMVRNGKPTDSSNRPRFRRQHKIATQDGSVQAEIHGNVIFLLDPLRCDAQRQREEWALEPLNRIHWHQVQATQAEQTQAWFAAAFHHDQLLKDNFTQNRMLRYEDSLRNLDRWDGSAKQLVQVRQFFGTPTLKFQLATAQAFVGDPAYGRTCQELVDRSYRRTDAGLVGSVVGNVPGNVGSLALSIRLAAGPSPLRDWRIATLRACLLKPQRAALLQRLLPLTEGLDPEYRGALLCRLHRPEEAAALLRHSQPNWPAATLYLALTELLLGNSEQAHRLLDQAGKLDCTNWTWEDRLGFELLRREVQDLLKPPQRETPLGKTEDEHLKAVLAAVDLDPRLRAVLKGEAKPTDVAEQMEMASTCLSKGLTLTAARMYQQALAIEPKRRRVQPARAAVLAGCGQGKDVAQLDEAARARWRKQGLDWLRADLDEWRKRVESQKLTPKYVESNLTTLQRYRDLALVREEQGLAKLPEVERAAWQKYWADLAALIHQAQQKK